ncbi:Diguanylate cyclase, GGDEF domain [Solimonas aquatica]|uniref:Diguanylate cyclase, GGDEF domain n=1 Tax=Solimonas aquatica TaxID=489703 RepID=A0A1H9JX56_9GAMM|nr:GGDEF domain-containing phosphodiesterase [Solimonas aquatica]SEQ91085.1 Diguanylate cyclase, GGDEF domain [Solimonas aquatica]
MTIRLKLILVLILVNLAIVLAGLVMVPTLDVGRDIEAHLLGRSNRVSMAVLVQRALLSLHQEANSLQESVQAQEDPTPHLERLRAAKTVVVSQFAFMPVHDDEPVSELRRFVAERSAQLDPLLSPPIDEARARQIGVLADALFQRTFRDLAALQEQDVAMNMVSVSNGLAQMRRGLMLSLTAVFGCLLLVAATSLLAWRRLIAPLGVMSANLNAVLLGREPELPMRETADEFGDIVRAMRRIQSQADQIRRIAYLDPGTHLPNRNSLEAELREVRRLRPIDGSHGLIVICLNLYGTIRSGFGLRLAETMMRNAGERLRNLDPLPTQVFRMDSDILAVLVDRGSAEAVTRADLKRVAAEAIKRLSQPLEVDEQRFLVEPSAGAANYPDDARDPEEYINVCLEALRLARGDGSGHLRFGERGHTHRLRRHLALAEQIRSGLREGQFVPYFQPIVDVARRKVIGVETLVRWRQPDGRVILPAEFIPIAENSDLIEEMTRSVLGRACRSARVWREQGLEITLGFNLSARMLRINVIDTIRRVLQETQLPAELLAAEITETALMGNVEDVGAVVSGMHGMGLRIVLDDFGTGYSSLAHLNRFAVDGLKIDHGLMRDATRERRSQEIIRSMVDLASRLELSLVVEGVESEDDLRLMQKLGCRRMQGFFFTRALPEEQIIDWLRGYEAGILAA